MFIRDVVLGFSADQQRGQEERLVQLILQVNVVVALKGKTSKEGNIKRP